MRFEPYKVETQMSHSLTDIVMQFPGNASAFAFLGINQAAAQFNDSLVRANTLDGIGDNVAGHRHTVERFR